MKLQFIKHQDILFRDLLRVIRIKTTAWPFPLESQLHWMIDNMKDEDTHVILHEKDDDWAYLSLSPVKAWINDVETKMFGIGNVCSKVRDAGYGKTLITGINQYLMNQSLQGILFCRENLIGFYGKLDWHVLPQECVIFETPHKDVYTMTYNCSSVKSLKYVDRFI